MDEPNSVNWTERSLQNARSISEWIEYKFSEKEVNKFFDLLSDSEKTVSQFPDMFPESESNPEIRQAVVHKNLTIYYQFEKPNLLSI